MMQKADWHVTTDDARRSHYFHRLELRSPQLEI